MKQTTKLLFMSVVLAFGMATVVALLPVTSQRIVYADIGTGCNDNDPKSDCGDDDTDFVNLRKKAACQSSGGFWSYKLQTDDNGVSGPDSPVDEYYCFLKVNKKNKDLCSEAGGSWKTGQPVTQQVIAVTGPNPAVCTLQPLDDNSKDQDRGENDVNIFTNQDKNDCKDGLEGDCKIVETIILITNVLAGLAATVIVAMIVVGGIQYSMAGSDAAKVQAAKQKITNALIALLLLIFGFSFIQWLVPGGLI
jgi:hypothetical protein